jgi:hypothetical protein
MISSDLWVWLSVLLTFAMWSTLYKESKFYRWAQYTYIAVVISHSVVVGIGTLRSVFTPLFAPTAGTSYLVVLSLVFSLFLGIMSLLIAWRKYAWLAAIPMAILIGVGTGVSLYGLVNTDIRANIISVLTESANMVGASSTTVIANTVRILITTVIIFYFLFTIRLKGPAGRLTTVAKYLLLMIFGFTIGNSLTSYNTYFVTSLKRVLVEWLGFA